MRELRGAEPQPSGVALLERLADEADASAGEVKRIVRDLRPTALDDQGLAGALTEFARSLDGVLDVTLTLPSVDCPLPAAVETATYRIAMEALSNVVRHAGATAGSPCLVVTDHVELDITDEGIGIPHRHSAGIGLTTMRERAAELAQLRAPTVPSPFPRLSRREADILELMARGLGNQTIARELVLTPKTVRNHVSNVLAKLNARDRSQAIVIARRSGLGRKDERGYQSNHNRRCRRSAMSDQGWREFLAGENVADWVVLHGGATAVFAVRSLGDAARLAGAVAQVPGIDGAGALITLADDQLTVRLTRGMFQLEPRHVELARAVSTVAKRHGAVADRTGVQEVQLAIAAHSENVDVGFWRAVLGYAELDDDNAVDPLGHGSTVWMQDLDEAKPLRHAMHVDVSVGREHVEARLAAALVAGGRVVDDSHAPEAWTLADRAGNRVCICAWPDGATRAGPPAPESAETPSLVQE